MIPLRKLEQLPRSTLSRKALLILADAERSLHRGEEPDRTYLDGLASLFSPGKDEAAAVAARHLRAGLETGATQAVLLRSCNAFRHAILAELGIQAADWDFIAPDEAEHDAPTLPIGVYLDDLRSPFNVGAVFRTAEAFGVGRVLLSGATPSPASPRASRSSRGAETRIEWSYADDAAIEAEPRLFALETGGTPIDEFAFPESGLVIVGSEELGVHPRWVALARQRLGLVSIPLPGRKKSLNVGVAFGILMREWIRRRT